jgi:hypothetical protein
MSKKAAAQTLSDQLMAYSNAFARFDPSWELQAKAFERMSHQVLGLVDAEPRQNRRTQLSRTTARSGRRDRDRNANSRGGSQ